MLWFSSSGRIWGLQSGLRVEVEGGKRVGTSLPNKEVYEDMFLRQLWISHRAAMWSSCYMNKYFPFSMKWACFAGYLSQTLEQSHEGTYSPPGKVNYASLLGFASGAFNWCRQGFGGWRWGWLEITSQWQFFTITCFLPSSALLL